MCALTKPSKLFDLLHIWIFVVVVVVVLNIIFKSMCCEADDILDSMPVDVSKRGKERKLVKERSLCARALEWGCVCVCVFNSFT